MVSLTDEITTSGDLLWFLGALAAIRADASSSGGAFGLTEIWASQGHGSSLHRHTNEDESFFVVEGELTVWLGDAPPVRAPAGRLMTLPKGIPHAFEVTSEVARFCAISTPAGGEELARLLGTPAALPTLPPAQEGFDRAAIAAALSRLGQQLLGPRPAR